MKKKILPHIAAIIAVSVMLILGISSIASVPIALEETETSKEIFDAISSSIPSNMLTSTPANPRITPTSRLVLEQKTTIGEIISLLINKFPGMTEGSISAGGFNVNYQGKTYLVSCEIETTGAISMAGKNSVVLSIFSVKERMEL